MDGKGRVSDAVCAETAGAGAAYPGPAEPDHLLRGIGAAGQPGPGDPRPVRLPTGRADAEPYPRRRPPAAHPVLDLGDGHPARRPGHLQPVPRAGQLLPVPGPLALAQAGRGGLRDRGAAQHPRRRDSRALPRPVCRPEHQRDGPVPHLRPGVRLRGRAHRSLRDRAEMVPHHREPSPRHLPAGPAPLPDPAGDPAGLRALRLHRPDGPGRHDRGPRLRLRPDGRPQGAAALGGDPASRPAQLTAPDHHRHRHPDRLPDRGPGGHRDVVQLPRPRPADRHRRQQQGLRDAGGGRSRHRHRVPRGDPDRRHPVHDPEPPDPIRAGRVMSHEEPVDPPAIPSTIKTPLQEMPAVLDPTAVALLPVTGAAGAVDSSAGTIRRENLRQLVRRPAFLIGAAILLWWIICAVFGRTIAPYNPVAGNLLAFNQPPSGAHWFGTDALGRDVLSRVIVGARDILVVAPLATLLGTALGTTIGLVQGYFRGRVDSFTGRLVEAVLALPVVIVAFLFVVALGSSSAPVLIIVIGLVFGLLISRTVRTAVLQERDLDYIAAARLRDESDPHIMFVEILPNVTGPILVEFTVRLGYAIFTVATLSFLGFGIQPPTPDWGADIANSYQYLGAGYWWEVLFAALAIASLVVAINLIADSIEAVIIR